MIRILHLSINGSRHGGAEIQYEYLFTRLDRNEFAPIAICPEPGELASSLERAGVPVYIEPMSLFRRRTWIRRRAAKKSLIDLAARASVDLVHCEFERGPYAHDISRRLGVPVLLHVRRALDAAWFRLFELGDADHFIAIGDRYAEELVDHGVSPARVSVISDSTDHERFRPDPVGMNVLERDHGRAGTTKIGLVGRFEEAKRQREAVMVLAPLLARHPDWTLYLIGDPVATNRSYSKDVRSMIPAASSNQVIETGKRSDMPDILRSLDVLLTLSGGSVMVEALASGLPVVSMSDRDPADLRIVRHEETGLVVAEGDWSQLRAGVERLCSDAALREKLGAAGRALACAELRVATMVARTQDVYTDLLSSRRTSTRMSKRG